MPTLIKLHVLENTISFKSALPGNAAPRPVISVVVFPASRISLPFQDIPSASNCVLAAVKASLKSELTIVAGIVVKLDILFLISVIGAEQAGRTLQFAGRVGIAPPPVSQASQIGQSVLHGTMILPPPTNVVLRTLNVEAI